MVRHGWRSAEGDYRATSEFPSTSIPDYVKLVNHDSSGWYGVYGGIRWRLELDKPECKGMHYADCAGALGADKGARKIKLVCKP